MSKIMQHSHSKLSTYEDCPQLFKFRYIYKIKVDQDRTALDNGIRVGELADRYVLKKRKTLPKELINYADEFKAIRKLGATGEQDWSYTVNYEPCVGYCEGKGKQRGHPNPNAWVMAKPDSIILPKKKKIIKHLDFIDYKTGGIYESKHKDQADRYGFAAFIHYPDLETCTGEFWYLDKPNDNPNVWHYDRETHFDGLKHFFKRRHDVMAKDERFRKKPSFKCGWCPYNKKNSGHCDEPLKRRF